MNYFTLAYQIVGVFLALFVLRLLWLFGDNIAAKTKSQETNNAIERKRNRMDAPMSRLRDEQEV